MGGTSYRVTGRAVASHGINCHVCCHKNLKVINTQFMPAIRSLPVTNNY